MRLGMRLGCCFDRRGGVDEAGAEKAGVPMRRLGAARGELAVDAGVPGPP